MFTVPKPFRGRVGDIQRNAIESWLALRDDVQVVLVGDEEGVEEAARAAGVVHVGGLARNERGTPRLDSAFERAATVARWPLWCLVNADILLLDDFLPAIERTRTEFDDFLLIGECRDLDVGAGARLEDPAVRARLRESALAHGRLRGYAALDYFVFRRGLFDPVPPFLIGRACFDNWLVWRARELNRPVVDATQNVVAIHQSHDYSHVRGGLDEAYSGPEAKYNQKLAGGREHIYSLHDATHRLNPNGRPVRYWGSTLRARERARGAKARVDYRIAARRARRRVERPVRLLGVYAQPSARTTSLLDALAGARDVELAVLYATGGLSEASTPAGGPRHVHWFPRSVRFPPIDRALGRDYPVNWAIWKSFRAHRPDCMLIEGCSIFATQSAIAWCVAARVPFLLVVDESEPAHGSDSDGGWQRALAGAAARKAAAVLVPTRAAQGSLLTHGVPGDRRRTLPEAADAAAAQVHRLARSAWMNDSLDLPSRAAPPARLWAAAERSLTRPLTRRARIRRTRSAPASRRG